MPVPDTALRQQVGALYTDHHGWLLAWLRRKLGCGHQAADVAHDTFLRMLGLSALPAPLLEPRAYLATTARRLLIDRARHRRIEQAYLDAQAAHQAPDAAAPSSEEVLQAVQTLLRIEAALQALPDKGRQAFVLHYLEGHPQDAVASELGVSVRMVQKYLSQALVRCHAAARG